MQYVITMLLFSASVLPPATFVLSRHAFGFTYGDVLSRSRRGQMLAVAADDADDNFGQQLP